MNQKTQGARGTRPYTHPGVASRKLSLGVYGDYSGGDAVTRCNDPSGAFPGSGGHRNSGSP